MDVLFLSRLQFGFATVVHFFFVPLTLGLSFILAMMETQYARTGDPEYLRMTKFWGKIFLVNFAMGVVSGITLEFQFGTNWSRYSAYVGDIFGSLLAIEALGFFFLESTLLGVWIFGWKKLSPKAHAIVMWLVMFASCGSSIWILTANGWMQHPVGHVIQNGRAELESFIQVMFNPFAWYMIFHVLPAAFTIGAFFVMGVSAFHLLKKQEIGFFTKSFRLALIVAVASSIFLLIEGDMHGKDVAKTQPAKMAALESHWETQANAPLNILAWPDEENERNLVQGLALPGMLSWLAFGDTNATVKGLKDFPKEERPPVLPTFISFRLMVGLGMWLILMSLIGVYLRNKLLENRWYLFLMVLTIPLPYIAAELGWILAEMGRQPWIVYGLMKTKDAYSPISVIQNWFSFVAFFFVYVVLSLATFGLIIKKAIAGPQPG